MKTTRAMAPTPTARIGPRDPVAIIPTTRRAEIARKIQVRIVFRMTRNSAITSPVAIARASQIGLESKPSARPPPKPAMLMSARSPVATSHVRQNVMSARSSRIMEAATAVMSVAVNHVDSLFAPYSVRGGNICVWIATAAKHTGTSSTG